MARTRRSGATCGGDGRRRVVALVRRDRLLVGWRSGRGTSHGRSTSRSIATRLNTASRAACRFWHATATPSPRGSRAEAAAGRRAKNDVPRFISRPLASYYPHVDRAHRLPHTPLPLDAAAHAAAAELAGGEGGGASGVKRVHRSRGPVDGRGVPRLRLRLRWRGRLLRCAGVASTARARPPGLAWRVARSRGAGAHDRGARLESAANGYGACSIHG